MEPTQELIDALYREEVLRARRMKPGDKLFAGADLFDYACEITKSGIRHQHPDADEQQVLALLRDRLALARRLENA
jgi:hypothetical protein